MLCTNQTNAFDVVHLKNNILRMLEILHTSHAHEVALLIRQVGDRPA